MPYDTLELGRAVKRGRKRRGESAAARWRAVDDAAGEFQQVKRRRLACSVNTRQRDNAIDVEVICQLEGRLLNLC